MLFSAGKKFGLLFSAFGLADVGGFGILKTFQEGPALSSARVRWSRAPGGMITDLEVAASGRKVVLAFAPDPDSEYGLGATGVAYYSSNGKRRWFHKTATPVKDLAVDSRGSWVAIQTHDERLGVYSAAGKVLW